MAEEKDIEKEFDELVATCFESKLYHIINHLGGYVWHTNHYMGRRPGCEPTESTFQSLARAQSQIQRAVAQTTRFGVTQPFLDEMTKSPTPEYWRWFNWWHDWTEGLPLAEWQGIEKRFNEGTDAEIRPPGDWKTPTTPLAGSQVENSSGTV